LKAGEAVVLTLKNDGNTAGVQWQKVYGIFENAIYGGRIDNDFDMRILRTYMH
jgi:dynein heavy chain 2